MDHHRGVVSAEAGAAMKPASIAEYTARFPPETQAMIDVILGAIRAASPGADETISYGMPTFKQDGRVLAYFAVWKDHVGFYDRPKGDAGFDRDAAPYLNEKDTLRFPLSQPMPLDLIRRFVELRLKA
jgi:uncharacterized protein YdhG (YjbR/CyaY superfamily)